MNQANIKIQLLMTAICCLFFTLISISCTKRIEQEVEAQSNRPVILNKIETNTPNKEKESEIKTNQPDKTAIKPSNLSVELMEKKQANPKMSAKDLAEFGNSLIKLKGFNFDVDVANLVEQKLELNEAKKIAGDNEIDSVVAFNHSFTLMDGTKKTFNLTAPGFDSCCCGYYYASFPVSQITDKQLTVISNGKPYVIKRTKEIAFSQEHLLVDNQTMKKTIRKWQVPFETSPYGISQDGSKLYIEDESELLLEISETGLIQFVAKDSSNIITGGKDLREQPATKVGEAIFKSGEDGFMKFTSGSKSFIVVFQYVCT